MKFFVTCAAAYWCTSMLTGSAQNVATRRDDVSMPSSFPTLDGSVMSCRTTALPVLRIVIFSRSIVSNALNGDGNTGDPTINTLRTAAKRGPISWYDCPVIQPALPTVRMPPPLVVTPHPSPGLVRNTQVMLSQTPLTYPPWPCTTPLGDPVLPLV